jgi:hypothetical protein
MMWLAQQPANGVGGTMNAWDLLLLVLMAIAASAVVGALVTLAFLLIRRSGQRSTRALRARRRTPRGDGPTRRGPWSGTAVPTWPPRRPTRAPAPIRLDAPSEDLTPPTTAIAGAVAINISWKITAGGSSCPEREADAVDNAFIHVADLEVWPKWAR